MKTRFGKCVAVVLAAGVVITLGPGGAGAADSGTPPAAPDKSYHSFGRGRTPFDAAFAADGRVVVAGRGGLLSVLAADMRSVTGSIDLGSSANLLAIALGPDGLLRATDGEGTIWRINAALDKVAAEVKTGEGALFSLQYGPDGTGIAVGEFGTVLIKRPDAADWRREELDWAALLPDLAERVGDLAPHLYRACPRPGGGFLVVGEFGVVLDYSDGRIEAGQPAPDVGNLFACLSGPQGLSLVAGQSGRLYYRAALSGPWLAADSAGSFDIYDLAQADTGFLAVGQGAAVLASADGMRWAVTEGTALPGTDWIVRALPVAGGVLLLGRGGYFLADPFRYFSRGDAARHAMSAAAHPGRKTAR